MVFFRNRGFFSGSLGGCGLGCGFFWEADADFAALGAVFFPDLEAADFAALEVAVFFFPVEVFAGCFFFSVSFAVQTASFSETYIFYIIAHLCQENKPHLQVRLAVL